MRIAELIDKLPNMEKHRCYIGLSWEQGYQLKDGLVKIVVLDKRGTIIGWAIEENVNGFQLFTQLKELIQKKAKNGIICCENTRGNVEKLIVPMTGYIKKKYIFEAGLANSSFMYKYIERFRYDWVQWVGVKYQWLVKGRLTNFIERKINFSYGLELKSTFILALSALAEENPWIYTQEL